MATIKKYILISDKKRQLRRDLREADNPQTGRHVRPAAADEQLPLRAGGLPQDLSPSPAEQHQNCYGGPGKVLRS